MPGRVYGIWYSCGCYVPKTTSRYSHTTLPIETSASITIPAKVPIASDSLTLLVSVKKCPMDISRHGARNEAAMSLQESGDGLTNHASRTAVRSTSSRMIHPTEPSEDSTLGSTWPSIFSPLMYKSTFFILLVLFSVNQSPLWRFFDRVGLWQTCRRRKFISRIFHRMYW